MSFDPRPCPHCNCTSFHVIPGVRLETHKLLSGGAASMKVRGGWTFTIVACTQCGRTDTFTNEPAALAALFPEAQVIKTQRPG